MAGGDIDDAIAAELLAQEAKEATKKYTMVGLEGFTQTRPNLKVPRVNKVFFGNIIRNTDSHNEALRAKEARESRAKLKALERERERAEDREKRKTETGRLTPPDMAEEEAPRPSRRRKLDGSGDQDRDLKRRRSERELYKPSGSRSSRSERSRERRHAKDDGRSREKRRERDSSDEGDERQRERHSRRHRGRDEVDKDRRGRDRSRSPERRHKVRNEPERGHSANTHESSRRHRHRSYSRSHSKTPPRTSRAHRTHQVGKTNPLDPVEPNVSDEEIGPKPPPEIRIRGRGASRYAAAIASDIDMHFSDTYGPKSHTPEDVSGMANDEDDSEDTMERFRSGKAWDRLGADRLRAAGFTDEQVKRWEQGGEAGEKGEQDVKWTKKGEKREWDRGKVVDEEGSVQLKAEWGRLT